MKKIIIFLVSMNYCLQAQESLKDIDGNIYRTIKIGEQTWMQDNLRVARFNNGDAIINIKDTKEWADAKQAAYCFYENKKKYIDDYGYLYNGLVIEDKRKVCPTGWKIPSESDFDYLIKYFGGEKAAGGKMKENARRKGWPYPNMAVLHKDSLNLLPGGYRTSGGSFITLGNEAEVWSSSVVDTLFIKGIKVERVSHVVFKGPWGKRHGFSIRCIKE